jgi:DNA-directed RNA polymerase subunit RPC12/RpoP
MSTEREVIDRLRDEGYTHEFFIVDEGIRCPECASEVLAPEAVTIDQTERIEGDSNPDEESIVFAVSGGPCGHRGVLVSGFGPEITGPTADVLRRLGG